MDVEQEVTEAAGRAGTQQYAGSQPQSSRGSTELHRESFSPTQAGEGERFSLPCGSIATSPMNHWMQCRRVSLPVKLWSSSSPSTRAVGARNGYGKEGQKEGLHTLGYRSVYHGAHRPICRLAQSP